MRTLRLHHHPDGKHKQSVCASVKVCAVCVRQIINRVFSPETSVCYIEAIESDLQDFLRCLNTNNTVQ
jgi:hypothetical protein